MPGFTGTPCLVIALSHPAFARLSPSALPHARCSSRRAFRAGERAFLSSLIANASVGMLRTALRRAAAARCARPICRSFDHRRVPGPHTTRWDLSEEPAARRTVRPNCSSTSRPCARAAWKLCARRHTKNDPILPFGGSTGGACFGTGNEGGRPRRTRGSRHIDANGSMHRLRATDPSIYSSSSSPELMGRSHAPEQGSFSAASLQQGAQLLRRQAWRTDDVSAPRCRWVLGSRTYKTPLGEPMPVAIGFTATARRRPRRP